MLTPPPQLKNILPTLPRSLRPLPPLISPLDHRNALHQHSPNMNRKHRTKKPLIKNQHDSTLLLHTFHHTTNTLKMLLSTTLRGNGKLSPNTRTPFFMGWSLRDAVNVARFHPIPCLLAFSLLFFMCVEYTLFMIPPNSPPFDLGFLITHHLHLFLAHRPALNTLLAALNTVFVLMQTTYILWTWLVEGRPRATISALFMFTCRGILGYSTQLPLPQGFLGSGVDFPVGNVSFFLFFSGHVAGSVIASLDMRRMERWEMAWVFDVLNALQAIRLLVTRGHYTIDLAVGVGAGFLFDSLAGKYEQSKRKAQCLQNGPSVITAHSTFKS